MKILLKWFKIISMKTNRKKFQFMNLGKDSRLPVILNIKGITKSNFIRSLDNCLTFKDHIDTLCRNTSYKFMLCEE